MSNRIQLLRDITTVIQKNIQLSKDDINYIKNQVYKISDATITKYNSDDLVRVLAKEYINVLKKRIVPVEPNTLDVHEILKKQIGSIPQTSNNDLPIETPDSLKDNLCNLQYILGTNDPYKIQSIFNPKSLEVKTYLYLDRRYQSNNSNNRTSFVWDVTDIGAKIGDNALGAVAPLNDVVKIKIFPFTFPYTSYTNNSQRMISITINNLIYQSYTTSNVDLRYHFMMLKTKIDPASATSNFYLDDAGQSTTEYEFYCPIEELTRIVLSFNNPFTLLSLDPDQLYATIAPSGILALLTFTQNPLLAIGDLVYVSGFTTTNPTADATQIAQINDVNGWPIIGLPTATSITIGVDLSGLTGVSSGTPLVYFESKRFAIRMELTLRRLVTVE